MNPQRFLRFLDAVGGGGRSAPAQDTYLPYWSMVTRKSEVLQEMRSSGGTQAEHASTCTATDCKLHFTAETTWMTPGYFQHYITMVLSETVKQWSERVPMTEELQDQIDTAKIYIEQWGGMSPEEIAADPRYHAFQIGFDDKLLEYIVTSYSFRVPKH